MSRLTSLSTVNFCANCTHSTAPVTWVVVGMTGLGDMAWVLCPCRCKYPSQSHLLHNAIMSSQFCWTRAPSTLGQVLRSRPFCKQQRLCSACDMCPADVCFTDDELLCAFNLFVSLGYLHDDNSNYVAIQLPLHHSFSVAF